MSDVKSLPTNSSPPDLISTDIPNPETGIDDGTPAHTNPMVSADLPPPPTYSNISTPIPETIFPRPAFGLLNIDYSKYNLPHFAFSEDSVIATTSLPLYSTQPRGLTDFLHQQAALPPKPLIKIRGVHKEHGGTKVDFDLTINMTPLIMRAGGDRWNYLSIEGGLVLEEWARRFCLDRAETKSFTLVRRVVNWDTEYLEGQIRTLISSLDYLGNVSVGFPITHSKVVVLKGRQKSWFEKLLMGSSDQKKYEVMRSVWPYATTAPDAAAATATERECASQSEQEWWRAWKGPIRNSVLARKRGWITSEDWIEFAMGLRVPEKGQAWGKAPYT